MSFIKMVLKKYIKIPELSDFKNPLFIGPHPDDIEFGCGGLISKMVSKSSSIHFLIMTDGASGTLDKNLMGEKLKEIRKAESINAANYLKVQTIDFVNLSDGGTFSIDDLIKEISKYIVKYKPDIIFAPDPDLKTECHYDHIRVGRAARYACSISQFPNSLKNFGVDIDEINEFPKDMFIAHYFTDKPNKFVKISKKNLNDKFEALKYHESQMKDMELMFTYFKAKAIENGIKHFKGRAEDYKVFHPLMMHVYSEGQ